MGYSQADLGRRFRNGFKSGKASNVRIVECDDGSTILLGYGHAVYAHRTVGGHVTVYAGWKRSSNTRNHAGSQSTKCQYSTLGLNSNRDEVVTGDGIDAAPRQGSFNPPQLA